MTTGLIGSVLCRIAAVFLFVEAARSVSWILPRAFYDGGDLLDFAVGLLMSAVAPIVGGIFLWKHSHRIGSACGGSLTPEVSTNLGHDDLVAAGVILIGLYTVLFGLVAAVTVETVDWSLRMTIDDESKIFEEALLRNWSHRAGYAVQIVLGVGLIFGQKRLLVLLQRVRRTGTGAT